MTRDDAVARIQEGLGFRTDRAANIAARIIEAQRDLERGKTLPKFLLVEGASLALVASSSTVDLPTDFLKRRGVKEGDIYYTPTYATSRPFYIPWKGLESARKSYYSNTSSGPQVAVLRSSTIQFFPTADKAYSLTWDYYKRADVLSTGASTNEWLDETFVPEYLIGEAGIRIAKDMRNKEALQLFADMRAAAKGALLYDVIEEEADSDDIVMGGDN